MCYDVEHLIMFFINIIGAYHSGLRNSCSIFRACSLICFLKLKYDGTFNDITHIVHSNTHSNPVKHIFSDIPACL